MEASQPTPEKLPSPSCTALDAARCYTKRGWRTVPVPRRSKNPGRTRWQKLRLELDDLPRYFNCAPQNVGVLLGEPSGWLVDIDLDHPLAVKLAPQFLPTTALRFGRSGKPESHWLYKVSGPIESSQHKCSEGTVVELRSSRMQTVFPPSTHESGEAIEFVDPAAEPALVDPQELLAAVMALHAAVIAQLGDAAQTKRKNRTSKKSGASAHRSSLRAQDKCPKALDAMLAQTAGLEDNNDGSSRLIRCARIAVLYDLSDDEAVATILSYAKKRPFKKDWTPEEILIRIRQAEEKAERGSAYDPRPQVNRYSEGKPCRRRGPRGHRDGRGAVCPRWDPRPRRPGWSEKGAERSEAPRAAAGDPAH